MQQARERFRPLPLTELRWLLEGAKRVVVIEKSLAVGVGGIVSTNVRTTLAGRARRQGGRALEGRDELRRTGAAENGDSKAVLEQQKKVDELRRVMLASHLEMRKEMEKVLTPEQVKQLRAQRPGWWVPDDE